MNYMNIVKESMVNGDGIRVVLFVSGCTHKCIGCQNPETWDKQNGIPFDENAKQDLFDELRKSYVSGITLSGGDPLAEYNRSEIMNLIHLIKSEFPDKTIWVYTGYTKESLMNEDLAYADELFKHIDVLVDGPFVLSKQSTSYEWAGSTNQRILRKEDGFIKNTSEVFNYDTIQEMSHECCCG